MENNTKILVSGKAMTQAEYLDLLAKAKEATNAYKATPAYLQEVEAKRKLSEKRVEFITRFIKFGKEQLGLNHKEIGSIGYAVYLASRKEENK